jgi:uncharacterized Zn-binding protein involved in type VI secretion
MPGVCRLGDRSKAPVDLHGCPACPHPDVIGPSISASSNVFVSGAPALRIDDLGMHASCCGSNMWKVMGASGKVFVNGSQVVRQGDPTMHCGGVGKMVEASANVSDGSPLVNKMTNPFAFPVSLPPPLPLNEVMVYPDMEPECVSPDNRGGAVTAPYLPTSGDPQIYNEGAALAAHAGPHAEAAPPPDVQAASLRKNARLAAFAGNDGLAKQYNDAANREAAESKAQRLEDAGKALLQVAHDGASGYKSAKDAQAKFNEARDIRRRAAAGDYEVEGELPEERDPNLEEAP